MKLKKKQKWQEENDFLNFTRKACYWIFLIHDKPNSK